MKRMTRLLASLSLTLTCTAGFAHQTRAQDSQSPVVVQSRTFDIAYTVNDDALPLDSVQLWYTTDDGQTWQFDGLDNDRQPPYSFQAPTEGEYGFTLVVSNAAGVSGKQPVSGDPPRIRVVVDFTAPTVQLHPLKQSNVQGVRMVHLNWAAIDANLKPRPIEITYQMLPDGPVRSLSPDKLANTGRYDWRVPGDLSGTAAIQVIVTDGAGHRVVSPTQTIELASVSAIHERTAPRVQLAKTGQWSQTKSRPLFGSARSSRTDSLGASTRVRASRLITEGLASRDQGDARRAISQLRQAVQLDPQRPDAFVELGRLLYGLGDMDQSLRAFQLALGLAPTMRPALQGAARVQSRRRHFDEASKLLRTILRQSPNDAETWLYLGDVAVFSGDESTARDAYGRAADIDPSATDIILQAKQRLVLMNDASKAQP